MEEKISLTQRLKDIKLYIVDLAEYSNITRPTVYRYIEYYEQGLTSKIKNKTLLKLFDFLTENHDATKSMALNYLINYNNIDVASTQQISLNIEKIAEYLKKYNDKKLIDFFEDYINDDKIRLLVSYIYNIQNLISKNVILLKDEQKRKVEIFYKFLKEIKKLDTESSDEKLLEDEFNLSQIETK